MADVILACIIMHNMIVEDEFDDPSLNDDYLTEQNNHAGFRIDNVERGTFSDSQIISDHLIAVRSEYMSREQHLSLKADLIDHLWSLRGENDASDE